MRFVSAAAVTLLVLVLVGGRAGAIPSCPPGTHVVNDDPEQPGGRCEPDSPAATATAKTTATAEPTTTAKPTAASPAPKPAPTESAGASSCAVGRAPSSAAWPALAAAALVVARRSRRLRSKPRSSGADRA